MDIWDFGGQKRFYSTHQFFIFPKAIYIVTFNVMDRAMERAKYWLGIIRMRAKYAPIILVGTHIDDPRYVSTYKDKLKQDLKDLIKKYHIEEKVYKVALVHKVKYKNALKEEVKKLKQEIYQIAKKRNIINRHSGSIYEVIPRLMKSEKIISTWDYFTNFIVSFNIDRDIINDISNELRDLGYILHFREDPHISNTVILNPYLCASCMYSLIQYKKRYVCDGYINPGLIVESLMQKVEQYESVIYLFEKFDIIHFIDDEKGYIIPSMLPKVIPDRALINLELLPDGMKQDRRIFTLEVFPVGIMAKIILRLHHVPGLVPTHLWKNGIVLASLTGAKIHTFKKGKNIHVVTNYNEGEEEIPHTLFHSLLSLMSSFYGSKISFKVHIIVGDSAFLYRDIAESFVEGRTTEGTKSMLSHVPVMDKDIIVGAKIGEGGFGIVYEGLCNLILPVALKEIKFDITEEEDYTSVFTKFYHEITIMRLFDNPYLISFYGIMLERPMMVIQLLPGTSLDRFFNDDRILSWNLRIKIARDVALGLDALRKANPPIVHRDLRSPNIFINSLSLDDEVNAVIGDFGLSQYVAPSLNQVLPTWQWLAPEILDGYIANYDCQSDIYSYGVIVTELASLQFPYTDKTEYMLERNIPLQAEQIENEEFVKKITENGYEIDIDNLVARKWEYNKQTIIKEILYNNLRPSIHDDSPLLVRNLANWCLKKLPKARPSPQEIVTMIDEFVNEDIL
eukprot:TRINITY_DN6135_c0_g3_i1.p1 TRINITY_DN6135_c0_g3~~TRINITY_DN6135_c0_g3_i1.p1  ORF type:complete len:832 (-),score=157.33 TRINITY_DN6135_c0_g3_i1:26-2230(-)